MTQTIIFRTSEELEELTSTSLDEKDYKHPLV